MTNVFKIVLIYLLAFLTVPRVGYTADLMIADINKGQKAPFTGVLLTQESALYLFADLRFTREECDIRLRETLEHKEIVWAAQLETLKLKADAEQTRLTSMIQIRDERIEELEKSLKPPSWYETNSFWFITGTLIGVALSIGTNYAIAGSR